MSRKAALATLIACVCAAVTAVHWPALRSQALSFDDDHYLVYNDLVKNPGWSSTGRFFAEVLEPSTLKGYYQPLAMISLMVDYALGGRVDNLMPFHRTSLALHAANTALIVVLLYMLFGRAWIAAGVGLWFGLHPMTVETISWVGERKTLLAAFFSFGSIFFYLGHTRVSNAGGLKSKNLWFCFLCYLLALMSKPTSTPLPFLLLLLDFWPLGRLRMGTVLEKIPLFILGGVAAAVTYISQTRTAGSTLPTGHDIWYVPLTLCHNIMFYLHKMVWPAHLSSHYPFPDPLNLSQPMVLAGVIGTCILIPLLVVSLRRTRAAFCGWLFFLVAILPAMQIIGFSNVIASDKYAYLPAFGLLMALAFFLGRLTAWGVFRRTPGAKLIMVFLVLAIGSAESLATRRYLVHWHDSIRLSKYMLSKSPNAPSLYNYLGAAYSNQGRYPEAIEAYRRALRIWPACPGAHYNLGVAYEKLGRYREAVEAYQREIDIWPEDAYAHYNLGAIYGKLGRYREAVEAFKKTLGIKPDYFDAHYNLGDAYGKLGRFQEATFSLMQAVRIKPDNAEAHNNLGIAYYSLGRYPEAVEAFKLAQGLRPDYAKAHHNLGLTYGQLGRYPEAVEAFKQAVRIEPDLAVAHHHLGLAYLNVGDKGAAMREYAILKTLAPELATTLFASIHK